MTSFPTPLRDRQRLQPYRNAGDVTIPPFAILGPQYDQDDQVDAIEGAEEQEHVLRLGQASVASIGGQDAALYYVNGPQAVSAGQFGNCTQDGPMQALVGYPKEKPPVWNDYLAIDLSGDSRGSASFALTPGSGGYRLISFHGCPITSFQDSKRPDYEYRIAWVAPAYHENVPAGLIFRMGSGAAVVEPKSIVTFGSALGPQWEAFGPTARILDTADTAPIDRTDGFFRIPSQGQYLLNFSAAIRSTDAPTAGGYTLGLIARTGRYGDAIDANLDRGQIEQRREVLVDGAHYPRFNNRHQLLAATLGLQPADTNLYHDEVNGYISERTTRVVARHWFTVSGSTVLDIYAGDTFFFYNPTAYQLEIENFSGTLTQLPGIPTFTTSNNLRGIAS